MDHFIVEDSEELISTCCMWRKERCGEKKGSLKDDQGLVRV